MQWAFTGKKQPAVAENNIMGKVRAIKLGKAKTAAESSNNSL